MMNRKSRIRKKISAKNGQLGNLDMPYIVAINVDDLLDEEIDMMEVLFGTEQYVFSKTLEDRRPRIIRDTDGVWGWPTRPQNTKISAVLIFNDLNPYSIARRPCRLWHNPWARLPLDTQIFPIPQAVPQNGQMTPIDGKTLGELLKLANAWPEE